MASLASHVNVWETCLQILHRRGYRLAAAVADEEEYSAHGWHAEKDGFAFWAANPIELLGLVGVYDEMRPERSEPYWWSAKTAKQDPPLYERLIDDALAALEARAAELTALRDSDPAAWEAEIRAAFDESGDAENAADHLGISLRTLRRFAEDARPAG